MKETRAEKAQRLVDEGKVRVWGSTKHLIRANVIHPKGYYITILYPNGHYDCLCEWGRTHPHTTDLCAHALAVKLAVERKDKPC